MTEAEQQKPQGEDNALEQQIVADIGELRADHDILSESDDAAAMPEKQNASGKRSRWYIAHAYSGFEHKIKQQILEKAIQNGISDQIEEIVVPSENVVEMRRGKKVDAEKKFFPGYILIKMQLTDAAWHLVKNVDKVTGFLGADGKPQRVPQSEVDAIFKQMEDGVSAGTRGIFFEIGENIKITDGPFESFTGVVEDVDEDREKVKVSVSIFGRATPVELDYTQVQKA